MTENKNTERLLLTHAFRLNEPEHENDSNLSTAHILYACTQFYVHRNIHKSIPFGE